LPPPAPTLFPYPTLFRSERVEPRHLEADQRVPGLVVGRQAPLLLGEHHTLALEAEHHLVLGVLEVVRMHRVAVAAGGEQRGLVEDRKSTRLNSSHEWISY